GLVLTKLDGDARGGAALAVKAVTGVPIKFLGTGETLERLEEVPPEGLGSRILRMGDLGGLGKDLEEDVGGGGGGGGAGRLLKGQFGLDDLLKQLKMVQKLGPLRDVVAKLPMFGQLADEVEDSQMVRVESLIGSMTPEERKRPELIDKSRARRIARGSGRRSSEVRELVSRFEQMREMMSGLGAPGGLLSKIPGMGRLAGAGGGDPSAPLGGRGGGRRAGAKRRAQQRGKRKQARKPRKKNRRP